MLGLVRVKCLFCPDFCPCPLRFLFYFEVWFNPCRPAKFPTCVIGLSTNYVSQKVFVLFLVFELWACLLFGTFACLVYWLGLNKQTLILPEFWLCTCVSEPLSLIKKKKKSATHGGQIHEWRGSNSSWRLTAHANDDTHLTSNIATEVVLMQHNISLRLL